MQFTPMQAYIIVGSMFLSLIVMFGFVFSWMKKNNIMVSIDENVDGVLLNTSLRCRISKKKEYKRFIFFGKKIIIPERFFKMNDFFSKHPLDINYNNVKDYMITTESLPVIGITKTLNLTKIKINKADEEIIKSYLGEKGVHTEQYQPWQPSIEIDNKGLINNIRQVKVNTLREELWETTDNTTKADLILKMAVPIGLMVLAVACLIFFPNIYDHIMIQSTATLEAAKMNWQDLVTTNIPLG